MGPHGGGSISSPSLPSSLLRSPRSGSSAPGAAWQKDLREDPVIFLNEFSTFVPFFTSHTVFAVIQRKLAFKRASQAHAGRTLTEPLLENHAAAAVW